MRKTCYFDLNGVEKVDINSEVVTDSVVIAKRENRVIQKCPLHGHSPRIIAVARRDGERI